MANTGLLVEFVFALGAAFIGAVVAARLGQSVILGYILAGIAIGPFTPGFVADIQTVRALADIGVIFLLFAIGVQLSFQDLLRVGKVAIAGGSIQVVIMIALGYGVGIMLGWRPLEALFFGAVLSNSSSTVLSKVLSERNQTDAEHGRIGLAWSTVQDISTIVLVVVLSALATGGDAILAETLWAIGKAILFLVLLIPVGLRVFPFILERVAALRIREVFILAVAAIALGMAYVASLFGISLALGAFVVGVVVGESDLSHQILGAITPLRDVLAGIFFVAVGMLIDPRFVVENLAFVFLVLALIVLAKGAMSSLITAAFRYSAGTAILTGVVLAQSAEFSFLLARLGVDLGVVSPAVFSLMLAGAAGSIILAPWLYKAAGPAAKWAEERSGVPSLAPGPTFDYQGALRGHAVICGYGRVGRVIATGLREQGIQLLVLDQDQRVIQRLRGQQGVVGLRGHAENSVLLDLVGLDRARVLVIAIPDALATREIVDYARRVNPELDIVARAHSEQELRFLQSRGVNEVALGEVELALEMLNHVLRRFDVSPTNAESILQRLREQTISHHDSETPEQEE
jgi:CPA2 family monovalent cation:H+ antiporter-2